VLTRGSAKVQIGAELLCKSERSEYRVWSIEYRERLESIRSKGDRRPDDWLRETHFQVSGLGSREPGSGVQVREQVQDLDIARARTCT
jgi:hypothetical protein